jgi:hypothetical protein
MHVLTPRLVIHEMLARSVPAATRVNRRLLRRQVDRFLRNQWPEVRHIVQWIHSPVQRWVYGAYPGCGRVYLCYDEYTRSDDGTFHPRIWEAEQELLREADVTFVTAPSLYRLREGVARRIELMPNGIPEFFFDEPVERADPIDRIPSPRIGYVGNIRPLLDFGLLERLFARRPDWQMVFVGPIEKPGLVRRLQQLPNVHFLGPRPHEQLPAILRRLDVGLMPFVFNDFTHGLHPHKLFEYLSAGIPVVSSDLAGVRRFRSLIHLVPAETDAFEAAISESLAQDRPATAARLRAEARLHTWTNIFQKRVIPVLRELGHF